MRAWELMKETFLRRRHIWIVHLTWLVFYGLFWWLFLPDPEEYGGFLFLWGGFLLPLALSAGIMGDDIASGRMCVLVTKPFWLGEVYLYRLLGLSLQAALHFILAGCVILVLHLVTRKGTMAGLGLWFLACWLLFNTYAALSTSLSVVIKGVHNSLLLFLGTLTLSAVAAMVIWNLQDHPMAEVVKGFFRYPFPPFEFLGHLGKGDYAKQTLALGGAGIPKSVACAAHSLILTTIYAGIGVRLLTRRQFSTHRD
ncbi:MAG: hypothetical protein A2Y77_16865 [Planctomycetes bacterium RBG_13_62_9]|nr:MAG: hypothetical protein A2Y77_16865 [Planctomycetes bacterium RBG_13_62_9]